MKKNTIGFRFLRKPYTQGFLMFLCIFLLQSAFGQSPTVVIDDFESKLSYTEETRTFFQVEDIENITELDKLKLIPKTIIKKYEKYLNDNNELTTVISYVSSENVYQEWMNKPGTTIIDSEGTTAYLANGEVSSAMPHSQQYLDIQSNGEKSLYATLPAGIGAAQQSHLQNQGFIVYTNASGTTSITKEGRELRYNPASKTMERNVSKNGALKHKERRKFKTLASGEHVLDTLITRDYLTLYNGACAEKITIKVHAEHEVVTKASKNASNEIQASSIFKKLSFQLFPVPVGDILTISANGNPSPRSWFTISVFDTNGRVLLKEKQQNPFPFNITTRSLPLGTYLVKVEGKDHSWTERFIKL